MYKDKALQRETTRNRVRRYRSKQKALHISYTSALNPTITSYESAQPKTFGEGEEINIGGATFKVPEGKEWIIDVDADGNPIYEEG